MQDRVVVENRDCLNLSVQQKENEVFVVKNTISSFLIFPNISNR